ncbi:DUF1540 domain-containing protein [Gorillibacterium massiliense]|uniref:DUF1540 domain-containing protein n=1 Tax=Gorillibacterium massiliense TaxID=1280390 RepID=UPI0004B924A8|nr:DUF1540 domain-containing protein [Gorillibacterium massiliense]
MSPMVKCSVANCSYWGDGNKCNADAIMIDIDAHAKTDYSAEFAGESFDSEHQDRASSTKETCCHTFKKKTG